MNTYTSFLTARLEAVWHQVRGHRVWWRTLPDPEVGCSGDIVCDTCQRTIWCRWHDPVWLGGQQPPLGPPPVSR